MRVRYEIAGEAPTAVCDLTDKQALKLFEELKTNALCEWGELVGEDDDNYMDILDSFDNMKLARMMHQIIKGA